ncbi:Dam family site-specific DNA-(adenine-N6)-methyltransferase [Leifsonia sp. fls2-241-R2A-40a]|uniref:DNA adenine methylase n=1 Tax=Leifsonia sp. fls2-241-R2A-40a TaxID=3040290 RepID=UPI002551A43E|nr:Dam family site-specific DNA-(adenine-N6)-methyltransferase [Leifsonia sp. fls2-241-R2A-40a]
MPASPIVEPAQIGIGPAVEGSKLDPFLRWAGGKRWLVPQVLELLQSVEIKRYHEPFLGGGSIFFGLRCESAQLSDLNSDLIEVYSEVRDRPRAIAEMLQRFSNTAAEYYALRAVVPEDATERAARFIFLNHTSYNGIFRVNLKGQYNVPYGRRKSANVPGVERLVAASDRLKNVNLTASDFETAMSKVEAGDVVFLDPPYTVAHNNNGFVKYNQHLFSYDDQKRLARVVSEVAGRGALFILTNAAHGSIDELFGPLGRKVTVSRRNAVGGAKAKRGRTEEYLFTNIEKK